jgi:hypothetical protein
MPTISLTQIATMLAKGILFAAFVVVIYTFMDLFQSFIGDMYIHLFGSLDTFNGLSLGYVAEVTGIVSFMNMLIASLLKAAKFYLAGMASVVIFHYTIKMYQALMKF